MGLYAKKRSVGGKYVFWPVWALCGFLALTMLAAAVRLYLDQRPKRSDVAVMDIPAGNEIRFHSADFPIGQLRMFRVSGTGITLAVKRMPDRVHVALSNCTVCSRHGHKSYAQRSELFCGVCNQPMRFAEDALAARLAKGQCPLPEVPVSEERGTIVISTNDVIRVADQALMK
jgi:hypothetical protein